MTKCREKMCIEILTSINSAEMEDRLKLLACLLFRLLALGSL
jgi:hypothetical protein